MGTKLYRIALFIWLFSTLHLDLLAQVKYQLTHSSFSSFIEIEIEFPSLSSEELQFVVPRSAPGTYDLTNYIVFYDNVQALTAMGEVIDAEKGLGSFFIFSETEKEINKIQYTIDLQKMESGLLGGFSSSKIRVNYLGLLGYSVFGFIEGLEDLNIELTIVSENNWPIFSTLEPSIDLEKGRAVFQVKNYALLADAQYLLGSDLQVFKVNSAPIPLFVAAYSETKIDIVEIGRRGLLALQGLHEYFGFIPMPHYTLVYEFLVPFSPQHEYGFSMEHLNSMTATQDTSRAIKTYIENPRIGSIVHHIGHSWIPLRSYGTAYRPFEWQTAPIIETIWLNEGFIWYISYYHVLNNKSILDRFQNIMDHAPEYIQRKSLSELSQLGSTQYSLDFRIGQNLYARGALLAYELDQYIQKKSQGDKSLKDGLLAMLKWTETNQKPWKTEEVPAIITKSTGIDVYEIWNKWQKPILE